jgi:hypothetical protein
MAIASAPPDWLNTLADAATVVLLLELIVLLVIVAALMFALMYGARWLQTHVVPALNAVAPRANQALRIANAGSERVVRGVAEVHGIRRAVETGVQIMLHGRQGASAAQVECAANQDGAGAAPVPRRAGRPRDGQNERVNEQDAPDRNRGNMAANAG